MDPARLTRDDWMRAARRALLTGGPDAVRVEPLAAGLAVTKGSFYWHFDDRAALLEALVAEWEAERSQAVLTLSAANRADGVRALFDFLEPRVAASERGDLPSDAAIFAWAANDRRIAARVNAAEAQRVALVQEVVGDPELGEFLYLAYLGFIMRRRRATATARYFATLAKISEEIVARLDRELSP
jgi:AcrR family transcriptional regulator